MTTYLGKSCSFRKLSSIYVFSYFPFGFEGRIWDLIVSVPDHCLSFYSTSLQVCCLPTQIFQAGWIGSIFFFFFCSLS